MYFKLNGSYDGSIAVIRRDGTGSRGVGPFEGRMRSSDLRQAQRLNLYGLVKGLHYLVLINDLKAPQHLRGSLAWPLKYPNLANPLHDDLEEYSKSAAFG